MAKKKIPINPVVSEMIRICRKVNKLTQAELAEKVGVTDQTIRKYESGRYGIPKSMISCLADKLDCPVEFLYGETNCITKDEFKINQIKLEEEKRRGAACVDTMKDRCQLTADFFSTFLGYKIQDRDIPYPDTDADADDDNYVSAIVITDPEGRSFNFFSESAVGFFTLDFYEDVKKLLRYHLLAYEDIQRRNPIDPESPDYERQCVKMQMEYQKKLGLLDT